MGRDGIRDTGLGKEGGGSGTDYCRTAGVGPSDLRSIDQFLSSITDIFEQRCIWVLQVPYRPKRAGRAASSCTFPSAEHKECLRLLLRVLLRAPLW